MCFTPSRFGDSQGVGDSIGAIEAFVDRRAGGNQRVFFGRAVFRYGPIDFAGGRLIAQDKINGSFNTGKEFLLRKVKKSAVSATTVILIAIIK